MKNNFPRIHIFIYSWNKSAELEVTLRSLAATVYQNYKVFILNNGSTDGTAELLATLPQQLFREFKVITLPVNIGAPAARNWLYAEPETRIADYIACFDDDIEVQPDWLARLLTTLEQNPRAGVVGAKIINATGYVLGCANLYRRSAMDEVGLFDIQFAPTQFDDVDHHLRFRLKGWQVLFNGLVDVGHLSNSGGRPMRRSSVEPLWAAPVCLLDRIPFPVTCVDEAMLSEKFKFLQRHFQLRIQDGNLVTVMYMGMATNIFDTSQGQAPPELLGMGYYTLLRILEEKPYLEDVCDYIRHLSQAVKGSDSGLGEMPGWMDQFRLIRQDKIRLQELLAAFAYEEADPLLDALAERYPGDPELLSERTTRLIATGKEWESFLRQREALFSGSPYAWWWHWTFGASLFRCGRYEAALDPLEASLRLRANSYTVNLLAECHYQLGEREAALSLWRESLRYDPLQMHLYMKMHDCLTGFDRMVQQDLTGEKICVLIYCWNKRDVLEATLKGLAQSDLGTADILMLNNNSTDGTGDLMEQASAFFPRNRCRVIHLPTNVGAPAARNWLMAQPEARPADYIAYLDDDVDLPEDWLGRLLATLKAFPQAGVAGSRIVDPLRMPTLQYGDAFLYVAEENHLRVTGKYGNEPDYGQMNYIRSCVSVMGCCHLFRNKALYDVGEFDVRFSPSQVDDIEHDLRTVMKGYEVIYNGHNRVVHHQKTGKQAILSRAAKGNVDGNVLKMVTKHPVEDTQRIKCETEERDRQYLRRKIAELRAAGLLDGVRDMPFGII